MSPTTPSPQILHQFQSVFSVQGTKKEIKFCHQPNSSSASLATLPTPSSSDTESERGASTSPPSNMDSRPNFQPQQQQNSQQPYLNNLEISPVLQVLFGPQVTNWPYSDATLKDALTVKVEQERTKQEFYKAESLSRSLEIIKLAQRAGVPGHLVPLLFNISEENLLRLNQQQEKFNPQQLPQQSSQPTQMRNPATQFAKTSTPYRGTHERSQTVSSPEKIRNDLPASVSNTNPMESFRFGHGSASPVRKTTLTPRHQLSPSKIGAHAVSSLGGGRYPPVSISHLRHGSHQRTISLPPQVSIPESDSIEFSRRKPYTRMQNVSRTSNQIVIPEELEQETPKKRKVESRPKEGFNTESYGQQRHRRMISSDVTTLTSRPKRDEDEDSIIMDDDSMISLRSPEPSRPSTPEQRETQSRPNFPNDILS